MLVTKGLLFSYTTLHGYCSLEWGWERESVYECEQQRENIKIANCFWPKKEKNNKQWKILTQKD